MTDDELESFRIDTYNEGYEEGKEYGYECGMDDGDAAGAERIRKELEYEHEKALERSYKDGFNEAEDKYDREISYLRSNSEQAINSLNSKIKDLKRMLYNLRKENATITRSIQKST
ncbi:hypothetical protein pEaSNUABM50_00214 [Erwinia phage pEa_SNUABM_50]|uniref:Uncharacterized protein n=4 Tax=Eneladusvirus BF TaxID=2560751 RepID=A0A7L8ZNT1_9CAUD|nr:hypothetical protein FDH34_gp218 [Serratia phage BF]QOI71155.1 hypothetical protein pEaSNUABM12_00217 [Erwinia phage pEa_SNUABM_12]QOI71699.1 hypothetical protein pEaSNUABM47_00215 [Erwinia phage pEa_SNUABM_47]QOI72238.1 hypothetical protein pEaSNUABM50_00214 [Erwinia phage pEa_SNUABM_50]QXO11364.1 hypothetical protein pEaSNUABM19_00218 [Erwinia phage pEa_SNUABM_19]QXO11912.1 hypothetical protein pEaSNUABM44_00216 [Erwinia phage pEa_SNUABM_44]QXO12464.1 hypothetical protein pEaSNUABM49_002